MPSLDAIQDWAWANRANLYVGVPALLFLLGLLAALTSRKFHPRWPWALLCFAYVDLNWFGEDDQIITGLPIGAVIVLLTALLARAPKPRRSGEFAG